MTWEIEIENIAGILDGRATIEPGLNAVRASNWQGKSSFVASIKTALGVATPLTEGQAEGRVHLDTPDSDIEIELVRENGAIRRRGQPYLTDEYDIIRTDLFACLDERNEIRRTVREGDNLEEVLMRPLDFQNIDEQIADLQREREQVESELAQASEAKKRLPSVQEKVTRLEFELKDLREKHESLTQQAETDTESSTSTQSELAQAQSEREQAENQIERLERSLERTESRLEERRAELDDIELIEDANVEAELAEARDALQESKRDIEVLQSVYSANEMVLKENRLDLLTEVQRELSGDTVECWTCGSQVSRSDIADHLDQIGDKIANLRAKVESRRDAVEELEARREEKNQAERRKRDLEAEITELEEKCSDYRQSLVDAEERLESAEHRVEELSESVNETVGEITDVESDIKYREAELKDAKDELNALEARADRVELLEEEREKLGSEIEDLRNRKDTIKFEAREAFDEAIQDVLARFDTGFETARLTSEFELVVARDGREASLDALSEGELELLGFVTALAGYEAFDVGDAVPILLVDGVGGLADDNLHTLIDYLQGRTEYLVFTVYPEYASFNGKDISPAEWEVATDREVAAN